MGEFSALPSGVNGRAHIRAYAAAVGLDPEEVLRGLADRLPFTPDPSEALRARARERFAEHHPIAAAIRDRAEASQRRAGQLARIILSPPWRNSAAWRHLPAGLVDAGILAASTYLMLIGSAWIMRTDAAGLWRAAWAPLALSCLLMTALYGTLSRQLAGRTPGAVIVGRVARAIRLRQAAARIGRWHVWS